MTPEIEIVAATSEVGATLARLHEGAFAGGEVWSQAAIEALMRGPGSLVLLAQCDRVPAGFVMLRAVADEAEILTLAVAPEFRRRGIGRCLIGEAVVHLAASGCVRLFLDVASGNVAARALYAACGFETVGLRRGYYADGADAVVCVRGLQ